MDYLYESDQEPTAPTVRLNENPASGLSLDYKDDYIFLPRFDAPLWVCAVPGAAALLIWLVGAVIIWRWWLRRSIASWAEIKQRVQAKANANANANMDTDKGDAQLPATSA